MVDLKPDIFSEKLGVLQFTTVQSRDSYTNYRPDFYDLSFLGYVSNSNSRITINIYKIYCLSVCPLCTEE